MESIASHANSPPAPFYYLDHFEWAMDWLTTRRQHLLRHQDLQFLADFRDLPRDGRALLVRLILRQRVHFRLRQLKYTEFSVELAVQVLLDKGWLRDDHPLSAAEVGQLCLKHELLQRFDQPPNSLTKGALLSQLPLSYQSARDWQLPFDVFSLTVRGVIDRLRLIFFGNLHQDWHQFVLAEIGHQRFVTTAAGSAGGFTNPNDVDDYLRCLDAEHQVTTGADPAQAALGLLALDPQGFTTQRKRDRVCFRLIQRIERQGQFKTAASLYLDCDHPESWIRHLRCLERAGLTDDARRIIRKPPPLKPKYKQALERIRCRLSGDKIKRPPAHIPTDTWRLPQHPRVELAVAQAIGDHVFWVENSLINTLFSLTLWEAIWADVDGAFFHPFQAAPADLYDPAFSDRREPQIQRSLDRIDDPDFCDYLIKTAQTHHTSQCQLVHWHWAQPEWIERVFAGIRPAQWRAICEYLLQDLAEHRKGQPDLVVLDRPIRFIEVKGPGDRLQTHQRQWLALLNQVGIEASVIQVKWS